VIWSGGAERRDCTIRDISLDGARVETSSAAAAPDVVFLLESASGNLFECQVRWRRDSEMGLHFIDVGGRAMRRALIQEHTTGAADLS
jgi:hypothetical protein